ncbi:MAG: hypothetical protein BWY06_02407 [Candidatus Latescibacteria bacterium ADurb.Bin168]|nr:MAG: hypothetical protein BWY06_02407 [Candidatus Latescibacteria bacterium ADurb.Bin168]
MTAPAFQLRVHQVGVVRVHALGFAKHHDRFGFVTAVKGYGDTGGVVVEFRFEVGGLLFHGKGDILGAEVIHPRHPDLQRLRQRGVGRGFLWVVRFPELGIGANDVHVAHVDLGGAAIDPGRRNRQLDIVRIVIRLGGNHAHIRVGAEAVAGAGLFCVEVVGQDQGDRLALGYRYVHGKGDVAVVGAIGSLPQQFPSHAVLVELDLDDVLVGSFVAGSGGLETYGGNRPIVHFVGRQNDGGYDGVLFPMALGMEEDGVPVIGELLRGQNAGESRVEGRDARIEMGGGLLEFDGLQLVPHRLGDAGGSHAGKGIIGQTEAQGGFDGIDQVGGLRVGGGGRQGQSRLDEVSRGNGAMSGGRGFCLQRSSGSGAGPFLEIPGFLHRGFHGHFARTFHLSGVLRRGRTTFSRRLRRAYHGLHTAGGLFAFYFLGIGSERGIGGHHGVAPGAVRRL